MAAPFKKLKGGAGASAMHHSVNADLLHIEGNCVGQDWPQIHYCKYGNMQDRGPIEKNWCKKCFIWRARLASSTVPKFYMNVFRRGAGKN